MNMVDSAMHHGLFTWNNKIRGEVQVASKLNKLLTLEELMLANREITAKVLPFSSSDH